eukprot:3365-Heterococcus_DN1.PRE.1
MLRCYSHILCRRVYASDLASQPSQRFAEQAPSAAHIQAAQILQRLANLETRAITATHTVSNEASAQDVHSMQWTRASSGAGIPPLLPDVTKFVELCRIDARRREAASQRCC